MTDLATWVALVSALGAAVGVVIQWRRQPSEVRHTDVSTDLAVSTEARHLLAELRQERDDMRAQTSQIRAELADLRSKYETVRSELSTAELKIIRLETWVRAQGADPTSLYS